MKRQLNKTRIITLSVIILVAVFVYIGVGKQNSTRKNVSDNTITQKQEDDDQDEYADIKEDFENYWKSSPVYLCDLAWEPNRFVKENASKRMTRWSEASKKSAHAAFLLGECYWLRGVGIDSNISVSFLDVMESIKFTELPEAQIRAAEIFLWGFGISQKYEINALARVQHLRFDAKYEKTLFIIFVQQQIIYEKSVEIYKKFVNNEYYEGMKRNDVENTLLKNFESPQYKNGKKLLEGIEKPQQIHTEPDGRSICVWRALCCPFQIGFTITFDQTGSAIHLDNRCE